MAQRKKRPSKKRPRQRAPQQTDYPGWLWMLFGLAIGLSVAFAVYVKDSEPEVVAVAAKSEPESLKTSIDSNGESPATAGSAEIPKDRFDFYTMLPAFEIIIADEEPDVDEDVEPQAIAEPGIYLLQAGSFSTHNDADRRRAELALHGVESRVQRAKVNNRDYFRVYVGPIEDLDELNMTRSRLRAAKIDVMRIRLGD
jgi:cell division protein FtsN